MKGITVAAISSLVMRGAVGLRAIQFALERRGASVWAVPTVVMPWHPGLGRSTRTAMVDLPAQLDELATRAGEVDAVITGYFATAAQVEAAARFIDAVRRARPQAPILVDPVTGDERGRYVPDAVADAIRDELLSRADIATPNANELADFAGSGPAIAAARRLGSRAVVVTSAGASEGRTGAVLVHAGGAVAAEHRIVENAPRGTGDLFGAVFLSARLSGKDDRAALGEAAAATLAVIEASGPDQLALSAAQDAIAAPPLSAVAMREIGTSAPDGSTALPRRERTRVHGVDGCRNGWAVVTVNAEGPLEPELSLLGTLEPLLASGDLIAVDIPMGLPDRIEGPGREAEKAVRPLLGPRQSSVFSMPARAAVYARTYEDACRIALETSDPPRKVSQQGFHLFPKIRELDVLLSPSNQHNIFEAHAEVAFWRLNGEEPMPTAKRVKDVPAREGLAERIALLERHGFPAGWFERTRPPRVPLVDVVDAAAIALVARRCAAGTARPFPDPPDTDSRGLRIAIWA